MAKKFLIIAVILLMILTLSGCAGQQNRIGILDMDAVLTRSERAQTLQKQLSDIGDNLEKNYSQKEQNLSGENKDQELDNIYMEFIDNKQRLEDQLNLEINDVLEEITKEKNLEIILYKKNVQYGGIDITGEVIKRLDEVTVEGDNSDGQ